MSVNCGKNARGHIVFKLVVLSEQQPKTPKANPEKPPLLLLHLSLKNDTVIIHSVAIWQPIYL